MELKEVFDTIEELVTRDKGNRGLRTIAQNGNLYPVVKELYDASRVMIITGFCIKDAMVGETDGPIGAASLAHACHRLGKDTVLVTDAYSHKLLEASLKVLNINIPIEVVPFKEAEAFCLQLLDQYKPSHIVAVERPGRAEDGRCYSMRGEDISEVIPNTDILLDRGKELGAVTIAIGDGGNEVGMGNIRYLLKELIPKGEKIGAVTKTDYLIVAGVSNWGAHGIVTGLSILASQILLHHEDAEKSLLEAIVKEGAVDGCSKKPEMTVDGLSLEVNLHMIKALQTVLVEAIGENSTQVVDIKALQYN